MSTENDDRVLDYRRLPNGEYIVKLKQREGLDCETVLKNTMPAHSAGFIWSNNRIIMVI